MLIKEKYELKYLYLYFTGYCNLKCRHCWINPGFSLEPEVNAHKHDDIGLPYLLKAIKDAKRLGLKTVKITGGEPFLRKDIVQLLSWLKKNNIFTMLETNGTLIGVKEAKAIRDNSVKHVSVSVDGPDASTHERLRGVKGSFKKTIEGIKLIREYNPGLNLHVICCLWNGNKDRMNAMIDLCTALRVNLLKINPILSFSRADSMKNTGELLTVKEILQIKKGMLAYLSGKGYERKLSLLYDIPPAFRSKDELKMHKGVCAIKSTLGITGDGTISICGIGSLVEELAMGNVRDTDICNVWKSSKQLRLIREGVPNKLEGICARCMMKHYCLGKCRAEAYWVYKSLLAPTAFCELAHKQGLFPKSRLID